MSLKSIKSLNLKHKRVFLRADLNVPTSDGKILQDYRLNSILPTIEYIQKNGGKVILATHIGRPKASSKTNFFDKDLSTSILLEWFKDKGFEIKFEQDLLKAKTFSGENFSEILMLENLRFFNGEKGTEEERERFANLLKDTADIYINDAFGLIHRNDTSITLLPEKFAPEDKGFGLLIEKEIKELNKIKINPEQPFVLILGGSKIKDKIALLENFLNQPERNRVQTILIGGAIAYTFLKAKGFQVGNSLVEEEFLIFAKNFLLEAKNKNIEVLLPLDHMVAKNCNNIKDLNSENIKTKYLNAQDIIKDAICVDVGPKTIDFYEKEIAKAKTIFANGTMGIYTKPEFAKGSKKILEAITNANAYSIIGGGDCVAASYLFNLQNKFNFLSTGGGATLAFLCSEDPEEELPGLKALD